jgi:hypothetical protein
MVVNILVGIDYLYLFRYLPSLVMIFMGFMDCATTVIGTVYYGTQELNPLIAELVNTNLLAFVVLKSAVTVSVGLIFVIAERTLMRSGNQEDKSFRIAQNTLKAAYIGIILFLTLVVVNNLLVLLQNA